MNSDSRSGSLGLAAGAFAVSEFYNMANLALFGSSRQSNRRTPLLVRDHNLIKREKVMYQVGRVQNAVGGKDILHTFYKSNGKDREVRDAFKLYRPVHVTQWAYNSYNEELGIYTAGTDLTNQVSGTLTTTRVNAALNASFGFLNTVSKWTAGPSNQTMGLRDPGTVNGTILRSLVSQAVGPDAVSQGVANTITANGPNFRYLLGPTKHSMLIENMAPYMTDLEVYVVTPKYDTASNPLAIINSAANDNDFEGSTGFFPKEDISHFTTKPTHFRSFNELFRVVQKKKYRLAAGCNIELTVQSKGWRKITDIMMSQETPAMPGVTFYIYIRAKGPSGWVKPLGEIDGGICDIPVKLGYRIRESVSVMPCPYNIEKRSRIRSDLQDYINLDNVQFFNTATGNPTTLTATVAAASAMMGDN